MKKYIKAILIVMALIVAFFVAPNVYKYISRRIEISRMPVYYKELAEECLQKGSYGCCMSSVRYMKNGNYKLSEIDKCGDDFMHNMLKCIDSFKWCEPMEKASACEKSGGRKSDLTECNGDISRICVFPSGETCYIENIRNGKCEGIFSPKILCDNLQ